MAFRHYQRFWDANVHGIWRWYQVKVVSFFSLIFWTLDTWHGLGAAGRAMVGCQMSGEQTIIIKRIYMIYKKNYTYAYYIYYIHLYPIVLVGYTSGCCHHWAHSKNYFTSCDPHHDIYTFSYWQIFWHSIWHTFWHFIWHIFWHSIWQCPPRSGTRSRDPKLREEKEEEKATLI